MSSQHHKIKAVLYPNLLKNNAGTFKAQTISYQTLSIRNICQSLCCKPGIGANPDAIEYHVRLFLEEMSELLSDGYAINTGYFEAVASIRGSFDFKHDKFDADRHRVSYKFSQGAVMRKKGLTTEAEILHVATNNFGIQHVLDNHSGSEDYLLTPSNALKIKGIKIKLVGTHPDVGVYFINETTGERTKFPSTNVLTNQNSQLMIIIPDLHPGFYCIEHVTQYAGKGTPLIEPRTSTFVRVLQVT
jgi:hypothetical protein